MSERLDALVVKVVTADDRSVLWVVVQRQNEIVADELASTWPHLSDENLTILEAIHDTVDAVDLADAVQREAALNDDLLLVLDGALHAPALELLA